MSYSRPAPALRESRTLSAPRGCCIVLRRRSRRAGSLLDIASGLVGLVRARGGAPGQWNLRLRWMDRSTTSCVSLDQAVLDSCGQLSGVLVGWVEQAVAAMDGFLLTLLCRRGGLRRRLIFGLGAMERRRPRGTTGRKIDHAMVEVQSLYLMKTDKSRVCVYIQ